MIVLYEHPLSPYAQKVKIALREKNLPFESRLPSSIGSGKTEGEFRDANPRGEVPVLVDGATRIFNSTIILEYLEDKWPAPPMLPRDPAERARARTLEEVCDTHYEAINWGLGEIRFFKRAEGALADALRETAAAQTADLQQWLESMLGDSQWFNGNDFGWADLSVGPYVMMSGLFGLEAPAGSKLGRWLTRIAERPAVGQTFAEAQATIPFMEQIGSYLERPGFRREFRDHRLEWMIKSGGIQVVLDGLKKDNIRFTGSFV